MYTFFKNEYSKEDFSQIISHIEEYCGENKIGFKVIENSKKIISEV